MYYTPQFTDRQAKAEAVAANTVDMMAEYVEARLHDAGFSKRHLEPTMGETRELLTEWVEHHPDATLEAVSDQIADMVRDALEMTIAKFTAMDPDGLLDDDKDVI